MKKIGETIHKLRNLRGLSQADVANKLKMNQSSYSNIETGKTDPTFGILERLATIFNTTVGDMTSFDEQKLLQNFYEAKDNATSVNNGNIYHDKILLEEVQKAHEKVILSYEARMQDLKAEIERQNIMLNKLLAKVL